MIIASSAVGRTAFHVALQVEADHWWLAVSAEPALEIPLRLRTVARTFHAATDDSGCCRLGPLSLQEAQQPLELFAEVRR